MHLIGIVGFLTTYLLQSVSELPEHMVAPLSMLVMLPTIMSACGIFSIVSGCIIVFFVIVCRVILQNQIKEKEGLKRDCETSHPSILKQYSKVPVKDINVNIESAVEKCLLNTSGSTS